MQDKRTFVQLWQVGHHQNEFPHIWCAAPPGLQEEPIEGDPDAYFRPPYVGHRGWVGIRLDRDVDWAEIEDLCREAYRTVAPATLVRQLGQD